MACVKEALHEAANDFCVATRLSGQGSDLCYSRAETYFDQRCHKARGLTAVKIFYICQLMISSSGSCLLADEEATLEFGASLAAALGAGGIITLRGDLGSGKTTLSRGLLRALGHKGPVKSPTYTLVEPYEIGARKIFHYDLYRLNDPAELEYLGLRDFIDTETLTLIEWPEKGEPLLPPVDLDLMLTVEGKGRRITWRAHSQYGEQLAAALAAAAAR